MDNIQKPMDRHDNSLLVKTTVYPPYWNLVETKHRQILHSRISPKHTILDLECGTGNLLHLLPTDWQEHYLGIDVRSNLIKIARSQNPFPTRAEFEQCSIEDFPSRFALIGPFDWIIFCGIRMRVLRNLGNDKWQYLQSVISNTGKRFLYLEYTQESEIAELTQLGITNNCTLSRQDLPIVLAREDLHKSLQALEEGDRIKASGLAYSAALRLVSQDLPKLIVNPPQV